MLGQAFCEYIERFPTDRLPTAGGVNATVVVTMTLETLEGGLAPATLDTGRLITAGEARRLASQCGVIPVVLGSRSEVLDLGRTIRLHTPAQRTALRLRHKTCTAEGCSVPAAWCHAHHKTPWCPGRQDQRQGRHPALPPPPPRHPPARRLKRPTRTTAPP